MSTIVCDSREQRWEHVKAELECQGYKTLRSKLPVGDYALMTDMSHVIDRKQSLGEVESNLIHDHERFRRECELAQSNGIHLTVLVENGSCGTLADVERWINPRRKRWELIDSQHAAGKMLSVRCSARPPVDGATLHKIMQTMADRYGIEWRFCRHQDTGRAIIALLTGAEDEPICTGDQGRGDHAGSRRRVWTAR